MRRISYPAIAIAAVAVMVAATMPRVAAEASDPGLVGAATAGGRISASPARTCYDQLDADNGTGIVAQNFEPSFDIYDSRGADDFTIDRTCRLTLITVDGTYFDGTGTAESVNVTVYRGKVKGPGKVVLRRQGASYTDCGFGCLAINVKATLKAGSYWLGIQVNQDFSTAGEWGWLTNNTVRGTAAMWKNPADGFQTGCIRYTDMVSCIPASQGGDFAFSIQ